ncbi:MAG: YceI family protein [Acidimicrobiia bacterium]|jgi:polyisoprenoid-binding protein YceI
MRKKLWVPIAVVLALVVAAGAVWCFVFRDDAPAEVSLERATKSLDDATTATTAAGPATGSAGSGSAADGLDGAWTVDPTIGSFSDFSSSFAGFRVQEQLAGVGAKTAVGRTPEVTGTMKLQGTTIPAASFEVDMTSLTTDDARRDGAIRTQSIETARFPKATFTLTEPVELASLPAEGEQIAVDATGTLTLHGVTKSVTIPLEAQREGNVIAVVGQLEIPFSDFDIDKPSAAAVLSVDDKGVMEVQLFFTRTT